MSSFPEAGTDVANKIVSSSNSNNASGSARIPFTVIKIAANILDPYLVYLIKEDVIKIYFSENAKKPLVRSI